MSDNRNTNTPDKGKQPARPVNTVRDNPSTPESRRVPRASAHPLPFESPSTAAVPSPQSSASSIRLAPRASLQGSPTARRWAARSSPRSRDLGPRSTISLEDILRSTRERSESMQRSVTSQTTAAPAAPSPSASVSPGSISRSRSMRPPMQSSDTEIIRAPTERVAVSTPVTIEDVFSRFRREADDMTARETRVARERHVAQSQYATAMRMRETMQTERETLQNEIEMVEQREAAVEAREETLDGREYLLYYRELSYQRRQIVVQQNKSNNDAGSSSANRAAQNAAGSSFVSRGNIVGSTANPRHYGSIPLDASFNLRNRVLESHELDDRSASYTLSPNTFERPPARDRAVTSSRHSQQQALSATAGVFTPRAAQTPVQDARGSSLERNVVPSSSMTSSTPAPAGMVGETNEVTAQAEDTSRYEDAQEDVAVEEGQIVSSRVRSASSTLRRKSGDPNLRASSMSKGKGKGKEKSQD